MSSVVDVSASVATTIGELLAHLGSRFQKQREASTDSIDVPRVTVLLASGEWVVGHVLAVGRSQETALIATGGKNFTLVRIDQVSAATIGADPDVAELFGEPGPRPAAPPTKLQLSRRLDALRSALSEACGQALTVQVRWSDFPTTPPAMIEMGRLVGDLGAVLRGLADEALGRDALRRFKRVEVVRGEAAAAVADTRTLRIVAKVTGERVRGPASEQVESAL